MNNEKIEKLRAKINKIDRSIIEKIAERLIVVRMIGNIKRKIGADTIDQIREKDLLKLHAVLSQEFDLDSDWIKCIFAEIINKLRAEQKL